MIARLTFWFAVLAGALFILAGAIAPVVAWGM